MNKTELLIEMMRFGDTNDSLASALKIHPSTLSDKKNGKAEFTKKEIKDIAIRYSLSPERVWEIFFANE